MIGLNKKAELVSMQYLEKWAPAETRKAIRRAGINEIKYMEIYWESRYKECDEYHLPGDCELCGAK